MSELNVHHTFYNRAWYRTPILRILRQHPLVITTMDVGVHKELHANVPPPPRPSPDIAIGAVCLLDELKESDTKDPVLVHMTLAEHLLTQDNKLAHRIGRNILLQTGYIGEGYEAQH